LLELPDETVVYKSLGRAFVMAPKVEVQAEMKVSWMFRRAVDGT
jgi:chaperonin cofactor prefoldin